MYYPCVIPNQYDFLLQNITGFIFWSKYIILQNIFCLQKTSYNNLIALLNL